MSLGCNAIHSNTLSQWNTLLTVAGVSVMEGSIRLVPLVLLGARAHVEARVLASTLGILFWPRTTTLITEKWSGLYGARTDCKDIAIFVLTPQGNGLWSRVNNTCRTF